MGGIRGGQKKAIFADFRWVLNNSPSRDILKFTFLAILGHFGGSQKGSFWGGLYRGHFGGYFGGSVWGSPLHVEGG